METKWLERGSGDTTLFKSSNKVSKKKTDIIVEEKTSQESYVLGDIIEVKKSGDIGVIFKLLDNNKYWVALPEICSRYNHLPCEFDVYKDVEIQRNER